MIRNVLFDAGGVLVGFDCMRTAAQYPSDEVTRKKVLNSVFYSPQWVFLDMGTITEEEALREMQNRLDTEEEKRLAAAYFLNWHRFNTWPNTEMLQLVRTLKEKGFGVYVLSNAPFRMMDHFSELVPIADLFDGKIFSAEVRCIKPQKEIYAAAFARFGIRPEESFFIDDLQVNIEGARQCGMDGYCFADGDMKKLKACLSGKTGIQML